MTLLNIHLLHKCLTRSNMYFSSWMDNCEGLCLIIADFLLFSVLDQYLLNGFAWSKFGF